MISFTSAHAVIPPSREGTAPPRTTITVRGWSRSAIVFLRGLLGSDSEGGSLVEFAVVLPLLMMVMTGMFSFGIALNNYLVLTSAVGSGARALSLTRGQTTPTLAATDPCKYAAAIANSAAPNLSSGSITYTFVWTTINTSGTAVSTSYTSSCPALTMNAGDSVQMHASYPYSLVLYGWTPGTMNLTAQTAELVQ
jgi:Flp pilus assembly protein TadG